MTRIEQRLVDLAIMLDKPPAPVGSYRPAVISGSLIYVSGQLPIKAGKLTITGKLGGEVTLEEGAKAARLAAINTISVLKDYLVDLDRVRRIVKVTGYVASQVGFTQQAQVINGASDLYREVFGRSGVHARAAVGVFELPLGAPVEIDLIAEIAY